MVGSQLYARRRAVLLVVVGLLCVLRIAEALVGAGVSYGCRGTLRGFCRIEHVATTRIRAVSFENLSFLAQDYVADLSLEMLRACSQAWRDRGCLMVKIRSARLARWSRLDYGRVFRDFRGYPTMPPLDKSLRWRIFPCAP